MPSPPLALRILGLCWLLLTQSVTTATLRAQAPPSKAAAANAVAATFHVAPDGDDSGAGNASEPFATLTRAQRAVRALRDVEPDRARPIVVEIADGTFRLDAPLVFGPEDSGTPAAPVVYRAADGARAVLSGGVTITGWRIVDDGTWRAPLPDGVQPSQLFVNDQRRFRPRLPAEGYYHIERQVEPSDNSAGKGHDRFGFAAGEIDAGWPNLADVEVLAFHLWSASRMRIATIDEDERVVTFTGRTRTAQRWGRFLEGHRYLLINAPVKPQPGQWAADRQAGELIYHPRAGESPDEIAIVAPRLTQLLRLQGDFAAGRWVEHLQFQGLDFAHTAWTLPPSGQSYPQAEVHLGAAVAARGARHCRIDDCAVRHVGGYAIELGAGCRDCAVRRCELVDLGGGGVKVGRGGGAGSWPVSDAEPQGADGAVERITIADCVLAHGGRLHPAAVGVWIGHASHVTIDHNHIHDFYYTGISVGWSWGYQKSRSHHNEIAHNHVHDIGQRVLSDLAGIYTLGDSPGTTVHHNRFHDVQSFDYGGWGLYTDEGSTGIVMENNLVYRTKTGSFHQHYGRDNVIANNVLALSAQWQVQRTRAEDHRSFTFERNIVYWDGGPLLHSNWNGDGFLMERNLYWNTGDDGVRFPGGLTLDAWQERRGQDSGSVIADPGFVAPDRDDFRLHPDSPALAVGFVPFDLDDVGPRGSLPRTAGLPPVPRAYR